MVIGLRDKSRSAYNSIHFKEGRLLAHRVFLSFYTERVSFQVGVGTAFIYHSTICVLHDHK